MTTRNTTLRTVLWWGSGIILLALYVYTIVAAIGNWRGIAEIATVLTGGLSTVGALWLSVGIATPIVLLALALILGRNRAPAHRILLLVLGLSLIAVLQLNMMHFIPTTVYLGE